ncbi:MAG: flagellar biosynthesis protein FlhB [Rhodospirillales bacterium]|nr:flagellar biosynthesis protein FlhB [Rhodospirillales bacterium]
MAEGEDESSKTEEATERKLQQARERGQVVHSQDIQTWAALMSGTMALAFLAPGAAERFVQTCLRFIERPEQMQIGFADARAGVAAVLLDVGIILGPILLLITVIVLGSALAQSGLIWAPDRLKPDFSKLSPLKGLQRLASVKSAVEFVRNLIKLGVVAGVLAALVVPLAPSLPAWPAMAVTETLVRTDHILVRMAAGVAATITLVAILDYVYQRFAFLKQMRMSKQELRDEFKQSDGDPHIKAQIRRLRQQRARKRMMAAVPGATVVITNPTHFAVALAYDTEAMPAPKVVAKGVDSLALRIREVALEHGVPIVENPPLARALHRAVDLDDEIPAEHYQAVAQVIGFVMRNRKERVSA